MNRRGFFQALGGLFAVGVCPPTVKSTYNATTLPMSEWLELPEFIHLPTLEFFKVTDPEGANYYVRRLDRLPQWGTREALGVGWSWERRWLSKDLNEQIYLGLEDVQESYNLPPIRWHCQS